MRGLGYLLITLSFLGGSYFAVQQDGIPVAAYLVALAAGAAGVALSRIAIRRQARDASVLSANIEAIATSLQGLAARAEGLWAERDAIDVYDVRRRIDREFPAVLDAFVSARESLKVSHGLQAYADVMNPFSAGERYLNRAWSASTDGWIDETHDSLDKAREQFGEALATFSSLAARVERG